MFQFPTNGAHPHNSQPEPVQGPQVPSRIAGSSAPARLIQRATGPHLHPGDAQPRVTPRAAPAAPSGRIARWRQSRLDSSLRAAVREGNLIAAAALLGDPDRRPNLAAVSSRGHVALHHAIRTGRADMVALLLNHGADAGQLEPATGLTPLQSALESGNVGLVPALVAHIDPTDPRMLQGFVQAHQALSEQDPLMAGMQEALASLLQPGLASAARVGDDRAVAYWLDAGADVNASQQGLAALHHAIGGGHVAVVAMLCQHGADADRRDPGTGMTPLEWAVANGHFALVPLLAVHVRATDAAARQGVLQAYRMARDAARQRVAGAADAQDALLELGFAIAVKAGDAREVGAWLYRGADPNRGDPDTGDTALHRAAKTADLDLARELARDSRTIDRPGANGMYASELAHRSVGAQGPLQPSAREFIDCFRHVRFVSSVKNQDLAAVRFFVAEGANAFRRDRQGKTPLDFAVEAGNPALIQALGVSPDTLRRHLITRNLEALRDPGALSRPADINLLTRTLQMSRQSVHGLASLSALTELRIAEMERAIIEGIPGTRCTEHEILAAQQYLLRLPGEIHRSISPVQLVGICLVTAYNYLHDHSMKIHEFTPRHLSLSLDEFRRLQLQVIEGLDNRLTVGDVGSARA